MTVLAPVLARATARRGAASTTAPLPPLSALGLADLDRGVARRHRLHGAGDVHRREPRRARRHRARGAPSRPRARGSSRSPPGLRPDGWGTATRHLQRELVRDGLRTGDVATGMVRARQLGMLTYRGRDELDTRFGVLAPDLAQPPVAAYLDHHGQRFAAAVSRCARSCCSARRSIARGSAPIRGGARRARARDRRGARRRRARRSAVPVRAAARALSRAAGGRRDVRRCGSSTPSSATTRSSPIRTSSPRCCATRGFFATLEPRRRARFDGVGARPRARDPDRHDRLRHRRQRRARAARPAARRARRALRRAVPRHEASRCATSTKPRSRARRRHPAHDARARSRRGSGRRRDRRGRRWRRRRARADRRARRRQAGRHREQGAAREASSRALGVLAQRTETPLLVRGRRRRRAADHPPPLAPRRRGRLADGDRQRHLQLHHHAPRAGRAAARSRDRRGAGARARRGRSVGGHRSVTMPPRSSRSSRTARSARGSRPTSCRCAASASCGRPTATSPRRWASGSA